MANVLIVEDHTIVRMGLVEVVSGCPEVDKIGEAVDGNDAIHKVREGLWDLVILDLNLPGKSGLEVLKKIKSENESIAVLVLSMYSEGHYAIRAMRAGASGYLTKKCTPDELVKAVQKIAAGGKYITAKLAEKLLDNITPGAAMVPHDTLSDREYQVFELLGTGKQISEIARILNLSTKTVSTHRAKILAKMKMKNNAELIYYAMKNDLVMSPEGLDNRAEGY